MKYFLLFLSILLCVLLLVGILKWFHYLLQNDYIKIEGFDNTQCSQAQLQAQAQAQSQAETSLLSDAQKERNMFGRTTTGARDFRYNNNTPLTNHNVDVPLTTTYSCENFCGPNSQCSKTREQCTSDIDCYGCQPPPRNEPPYVTKDVRGQNDAGKMTYNQNPQYSELTTDIGTQASLYNPINIEVPQPYLGVDKWMKSANAGMQIADYKEKYKFQNDPDKYKNMPTYPDRPSVTGLYIEDGPLAANAYL